MGLLIDRSTPDPAKKHNAVGAICNMAAANIVAPFESKLEALRRDLSLLRWMLGFAALIAAVGTQLFRSVS